MSEDGAGPFVSRLEYVAMRLQRHGESRSAAGQTDPDPKTGETWEWGQVWAHLAEFVPYWMSEMRKVVESPGSGRVPFGRTQTDPGRIAAIERDRHTPIAELSSRLQGHLGEFRKYLEGLPEEAWSKLGLHPTLGEMDLPRMIDRFVVGHLEEHATQLDGLAAQGR